MPYLSIREASEDVHSGMTTPTELVAEALERIDQLDADIQAFITVLRDQAYQDAEKAEMEQRTGLYRSPLHGVPIAIKDIIAVKNVRTTAGSKVLENHISLEDATVVEQLRKAGAIILGKTNTHEFGRATHGIALASLAVPVVARRQPSRQACALARLAAIPVARSAFPRRAAALRDSNRPMGASVVMASSR